MSDDVLSGPSFEALSWAFDDVSDEKAVRIAEKFWERLGDADPFGMATESIACALILKKPFAGELYAQALDECGYSLDQVNDAALYAARYGAPGRGAPLGSRNAAKEETLDDKLPVIRVSGEMKQQVEGRAAAEGVKVSAWVRELIARELSAKKGNGGKKK